MIRASMRQRICNHARMAAFEVLRKALARHGRWDNLYNRNVVMAMPHGPNYEKN
jgi:hypothetical protein